MFFHLTPFTLNHSVFGQDLETKKQSGSDGVNKICHSKKGYKKIKRQETTLLYSIVAISLTQKKYFISLRFVIVVAVVKLGHSNDFFNV